MITAHEALDLVSHTKKENAKAAEARKRQKAEEERERIAYALAHYLPEERTKIEAKIREACKRELLCTSVEYTNSPPWQAVVDALKAELKAAKYNVEVRAGSRQAEDEFSRWTDYYLRMEISW